ncbi:hypothetical protein A4244_09935 [Bacillus badius]|nr:hypothetical protein A4244_09935 [Bacillus badius]OCS82687.1 hypothetical protein A6M11_09950 [Bacillus badius]OVE51393.1 hypothetical protein B1A98_11875 [Bacillus badius]
MFPAGMEISLFLRKEKGLSPKIIFHELLGQALSHFFKGKSRYREFHPYSTRFRSAFPLIQYSLSIFTVSGNFLDSLYQI